MKAGWTTSTLGQSSTFQRGLTYSKADEVDFSETAVLRANNIDLASNALNFSDLRYISDSVSVPESKLVKAGSLIICTASGSKSHLGKVAFIDQDYGYAFGGFMAQITPNQRLDPKFLYYALTSQAFVDWLEQVSSGVNINNLKKSDIEHFPLSIPPLDEQRRIVAVLDKAFAGIATATANAREVVRQLNALHARSIDIVTADTSKENYVTELKYLCDLIVDCEHKTAPIITEGIPSIRTPNIGKGALLLDKVNYVSEQTFLDWTRRAVPKSGDLIFAREAPAGNVAVIPENTRCVLGQRTVLIRPNGKKVDSNFLAFYLLSSINQKRLLGTSRGATVQHVNMRDIRELPIENLPSIDSQRDFAGKAIERRDKINIAERMNAKKLAALTELKQSLLQKAFAGELI